MKYLVVVNQKYIVSVESTSAGGAEHVILDNMDGIEGAQAFDSKAIKTETFEWYMENCETVSYETLRQISQEYTDKCREMGDRMQEVKRANAEMEELQRKMEALQNEINIKCMNLTIAKQNVKSAKYALGMTV